MRLLPEVVDAGVIQLRRRRMSDVPELIDAIGSSTSELSRFLAWAAAGVPTSEEIEARILRRDADFETGVGFEYVLREKTSHRLVGEAGAERRNASTVEIGYWVRTDRTNRGYATAAAAALTRSAFACFDDVARVELRMDKGNVRSTAVARRLGFVLVGEERFDTEPLSGQTGEGYIWCISRETWLRWPPLEP